MRPPLQSFTAIVQAFFQCYLIGERGLSRNTVLSYRDTIRLLLNFTSARLGCSPDQLCLEGFDSKLVRDFLEWLETERGCCPRTRNQRLAAIKTFFRYVASVAPEHLDRSRQIREIANKRVEHSPPEHLEAEDIQTLLASIDASTATGLRDLALLTLMFNTGARVQEIVDLDVQHLTLSASPKVRLTGKGNKKRDCPLWTHTSELLGQWLAVRTLPADSPEPLFLNQRGRRLSRWGIAHILRQRVATARLSPKYIRPERITPHTIRHTTAMELLRANVDITVIAAWLGHADLGTTHQYVEIDLRMKQAALEDTVAAFMPPSQPSTYPKPKLIAWLEALGGDPDYVKLRKPEMSPKPLPSRDALGHSP